MANINQILNEGRGWELIVVPALAFFIAGALLTAFILHRASRDDDEPK